MSEDTDPAAAPSPKDITARDLTDKLGVSKSYASELLSGQRRPSLDLAVRIEREFGVPPSAWTDRSDLSEAAA